jgi:predicted house-cleaning noncanonical NTP pyrophosphatase (MazG superfamily)
MTPIKDKKLLEELSLLLSEFNEENLQNILKFIRQLAKLTPEEQNILLKLFS